MTKIFNSTLTKKTIAALTIGSVLIGCNDKWDEHYPEAGGSANKATVYQMIKSNPDMEKFGQMIDIAGYADMLNTSQTFTVWVPDNASLADVNLDDIDEVTRIVNNHIARFNVSTSTPSDKGVRMYNGKMIYFEGNTFGGITITQADEICSNGILHRLSGRIPYAYNIREYIDTHSSTSSIAKFLSRFDEEVFDEEASAPIDINANGETVYDSVMISYNRLLEHPVYGLGDILSEDSVFTMIVPDNTAWNEAYTKISPLFKVYDTDKAKADSIQDTQTSLAIMRDLIFRGRITNPQAAPETYTTSGSLISDMASFFMGTDRITASNGLMFATSSINYNPLDTYNPTISVEAEDPTGRVRGTGTTIYTRVASTDNPLYAQISEGSYIMVSATSVSRQPGVTFEIPNTLSGKYDIYVNFVPASVEDAAVTNERTRLQFVLTYMNSNGRSVEKAFKDKSFLTDADKTTLIKVVEGFELPISDYVDNLRLMDEEEESGSTHSYSTKLYIQTNVTNAEFNRNELVRRFRVDRIIFVPSEQ